VAQELSKMCTRECRQEPHRNIMGSERCRRTGMMVKVSHHAQHYPRPLVRAICRCLLKTKAQQRQYHPGHATQCYATGEVEAEQGAGVVHPPSITLAVQKIHDNLGHCGNETLIRVLKYGRAKPEYLEVAQHLRCTACARTRRPKAARPAKPPSNYEFNHTIGIDIFFVQGPQKGTKVPLLNMLRHGTGLQIVVPLPSRQGKEIRRHYRAYWKRPYGTPRVMVVDGERGLSLGDFSAHLEADGTELKVTSATSPWQAGKTERAGGIWKDTFYRLRQKFVIKNWDDFYELVDSVNVAVGECARRGGYGPHQRVFGRPFKLPEAVVMEELPDMAQVSRALGPDAELMRSIQMRQDALRCYVEADCADRWRRALNRRSRPPRDGYQPGDRVYFWRAVDSKVPEQCWHGPARVVQVELPSTVWCSFQGGLLKCSPRTT